MTVKTKKIITVELVETNVFSRWHCTVCDGCTNPVSVLAEGKDDERVESVDGVAHAGLQDHIVRRAVT
jgi:hypothetical protein